MAIIQLPLIDQNNKLKAITFGYLFFSCFYWFSGHFHLFPPQLLSLSFIDKVIPFIPESILVYFSQFLFLFLALWLNSDAKERSIAYYAMIFATLIAISIYLIYPLEFPRPAVYVSGIMGILWKILYVTDSPANCFPSLHVAFALLATKLLVTKEGYWYWLAPIWAIMICISTLTTKQHYFIDLIGGVVLAIISWFLINALFRGRG